MRALMLLLAALLVAVAVAVVSIAAEGQSAPPARQMVEYAETSALLTGEWHELAAWPRGTNPQTGQDSWRTDSLTTLSAGPFDVQAGDVLDVRLEHEFDNENEGAGYWTVDGKQSEHWSLWAMASTSARLRCSGVVVATDVLRVKETNWDWYVHHLTVDRAAHWLARASYTGCYVQDRVYFKSGMSYTRPELAYRQIQVNGGQYPRLSVAVYR